MPGFEEGYAGLARVMGRTKSADIQAIVINSHRAASIARERVGAAMFAAMMKGDVEAVLAALSLLGVHPPPRYVRHG